MIAKKHPPHSTAARPDWDAVRALAERFMDGCTTLAEEQRLYVALARPDVPADLADLAAMAADLQAIALPAAPRGHRARRLLRRVAAAAAVVALLLGATWGYNTYRDYRFAATYAGSFVIENGCKITNLDHLHGDIRQTVRKADRIEHRLQAATAIEQEMLDQIGDPHARRLIRQNLE